MFYSKIKGALPLLFFIFLVFTVSAASSGQFGYNYLNPGNKVLTGFNYSINVNNSDFLRGTTWIQHLSGTATQLAYFTAPDVIASTPAITYAANSLLAQGDGVGFISYGDSGLGAYLIGGKLFMYSGIKNFELYSNSLGEAVLKGNSTFGNSFSGNYLRISDGGTLTLIGNATVYDDIVMPIITGTTPASNPPDFSIFMNTTYAYSFLNNILSQEDQMFLSMQMSHTYKLGSPIECHIHYACQTTSTNNVTWGLDMTMADIGTEFKSAKTYLVNGTCGNAYSHQLADWHIVGNFTGLSGNAVMRVYRHSSDAGDTYTGNAFGISVDCHYEKDSLGSSEEYVK